MRFNLVDRIVEVEPGRLIRTAKHLTLGEEYLADHFPTFPVMPGVLMLQTLVETGSWLLRITDNFQYSVILLQEARNVKFGHFMEPGRRMLLTMELQERAGSLATFKGKGEVEGHQTVSARITLQCSNLGDRDPALRPLDERLTAQLRGQYAMLRGDLDSCRSAG